MTAKIVASCMALLYSTGFVWFPGNDTSVIDILVIVVVVCSLAVSIIPEKQVPSLESTYFLIGLVFTAIASLVSIIAIEFMRKYGPSYIGITLDIVFIGSLFCIGLNVYNNYNRSKSKQ